MHEIMHNNAQHHKRSTHTLTCNWTSQVSPRPMTTLSLSNSYTTSGPLSTARTPSIWRQQQQHTHTHTQNLPLLPTATSPQTYTFWCGWTGSTLTHPPKTNKTSASTQLSIAHNDEKNGQSTHPSCKKVPPQWELQHHPCFSSACLCMLPRHNHGP